jgi:hypothetical protein
MGTSVSFLGDGGLDATTSLYSAGVLGSVSGDKLETFRRGSRVVTAVERGGTPTEVGILD